jgi:predicted site-specific integrase-resolvase
MNLAAWAERNGVARVTAYRWFRAGLLPVSARRVGRLILVDEPIGEAGPRTRTAVYARVSSADQKADLDRQVARVTAWATDRHRRKFLALLRDLSVHRIVVEHRDRSAGSVRNTYRPRWPRRAESWSWWTPPRSMTISCGI